MSLISISYLIQLEKKVNKPTKAPVGAARIAQNIHKTEFILSFKDVIWYVFGKKIREDSLC